MDHVLQKLPDGMRLFLLCTLLIALPAAGEIVRIIDEPAEAAQARVDLIQQAQSEIGAIYFLARNDRVTLTALALLRDAQRRGVSSRLVLDAQFHRIPKAVLAHLREEGVRIKMYHPLTLRHPTWVIRRMHEKLLVTDRGRYIMGGRNLGEAYFGLARKNYVDRDVFVEGGSAVDAARHFDELWESQHVVELRVRVTPDEKKAGSTLLDAVLADLRHGGGFVQLDTGRNWAAGKVDAGAVTFLHDPFPGADKNLRVGRRLIDLMEAARHSIVIESPYLIPPPQVLGLLERKSRAGVRIRIVTNSLHSTDGVLPFAAYLKYRRRLARAGIELLEFKGPDPLHAKSIVIDDRIAMIGTYNFDPRSHYLNAESMCVVEDGGVARELLDSISRHAANAWRVDSHGRMPEAASESRSRAFGVRAARLLVPFVEGQL